MSLELEELAAMAKDPEGRKELIELAQKFKDELYPLAELAVEVLGKDADMLVDKTIGWSAKKTRVMFVAYLNEGFTRQEALALTIGAKASMGESLRSAG